MPTLQKYDNLKLDKDGKIIRKTELLNEPIKEQNENGYESSF